jgi:hypothetical protein
LQRATLKVAVEGFESKPSSQVKKRFGNKGQIPVIEVVPISPEPFQERESFDKKLSRFAFDDRLFKELLKLILFPRVTCVSSY